MKRYDSYKDSGVEWIGEVPSHWEVCALKRYSSFINGDRSSEYPSSEDFVDGGVLFITSNNIHGLLLDVETTTNKYITEDKYKKLRGAKIQINDIIYCLRGSIGNCSINTSIEKGTVASSLVCVRPNKIDAKFLNYILHSQIIDHQSYVCMNGSCAANLSADDLSSFYITLPNSEEQLIISKYLDKKCGEIDNVISTQEKRIELLKELRQSVITRAVTRGINPDAPLRDSGVEWIGGVPEHWEVMPLKRICKNEQYAIKTGPFGSQLKGQDLMPEGDVVVYNQRNVIDSDFDTGHVFVTQEKAKDLESFRTQPNDLLITSRGTIGKCSILEEDKPMGILHPCLIALRIDTRKCLYKWVQLFINESQPFKTNIFLNSNATTIEVIYTDTLKNISIPVPPLSEQQAIVDHIERETKSLDAAIDKAQRQIELLTELKQSIITEVVTGNRKVC